jgi:hypothetical protein
VKHAEVKRLFCISALVLAAMTVLGSIPRTRGFRSDGQKACACGDANQLTSITVSNSCRIDFLYDGLHVSVR